MTTKKSVNGQHITDEARKWLDVPWRHAGRNRAGIDCVGLGVVVTRALGICDYDVVTYSKEPTDGMLEHIEAVAERIPVQDAAPGDILILNFGPYPFHAGFLADRDGKPTIIHANARARKVIEEPYTGQWARMTSHAYRLRGVTS